MKCGNCGSKHSAYYRACPMYSIVKQSLSAKLNVHTKQPIKSHRVWKQDYNINNIEDQRTALSLKDNFLNG